MARRVIGVATVGRSDYGIYSPILRHIERDPMLVPLLFAGGGHLDGASGKSIDQIRDDGYEVGGVFAMPLQADTPEAAVHAMGVGMQALSSVFAERRPDLLLVLGDRYEMFIAALAAVPFGIPLAHLHGGELTEGAIDEQFRHALTKLCHLHFASTPAYARRLVQMGEEPWRVMVSGAPALDILRDITILSREELERDLQIDLSTPPLLVTFHPVTREPGQTAAHITALLSALERSGQPIIFTAPNVDPGRMTIDAAIRPFVRKRGRTWFFQNLGTRRYWSLMRHAGAMVGNSSSGIIEAASFELPVVNIGTRQAGRLQAENVIQVPCETGAIAEAVNTALSPAFRDTLRGLVNPYGDGYAAERITERLKTVALDDALLRKRFHDLPEHAREAAT